MTTDPGAEKRETLAKVVLDVVKGYVVALKDYDLSVFGHSESGKLSADDEVEKINTAANTWASDLEKRVRVDEHSKAYVEGWNEAMKSIQKVAIAHKLGNGL